MVWSRDEGGPRLRGAAAGVRRGGAAAVRRVRSHGFSLLLAAAAAGTAFLLAGLVVGPQNAVFASVAAVVATELSAGQRVQRAAEISTGVVLGIVAADLLSRVLGTGPLQLAFAVLLAMAAAVAVRPSGLMANQAAVAAVVVVVTVPYVDSAPWVRVADALIGGVVAVALNAVVAPDPYRAARTVTRHVLARYVKVVRRLTYAIRSGSLAEAEAALVDMEELDDARDEIGENLAATRERVILSRSARNEWYQSQREIKAVADRFVILAATGRGLCRAGANLVRHDGAADEPEDGTAEEIRDTLATALEELIGAFDQLREWLEGSDGKERARSLALQAAATASGQRVRTQATAVMIGQIRSAVIDVLRITGLGQAAAVAALEEAAGRADDAGT